jgi:polysaccharide deacetylase 2 family uncharacterized protein YibQ/cytoskeletal protein RodZ
LTRPTANKGKTKPRQAAARGSGTRAAAAASSPRTRSPRSSKGKKGQRRSWFSPPLFTLWVVALVVLASLLIWANTGKHSAQKPAKEAVPSARQAAAPPKTPLPAAKTEVQVAAKNSSGKSAEREVQPAKVTPTPAPPPAPAPAPTPATAAAPPPPAPAPPPREPSPEAQAKPAPVQAAVQPPQAETAPLTDEYQHISLELLRDSVEHLLRDFFKKQGIAEDQVRSRQVKRSSPDGTVGYVQETEVQCGADRDLRVLQDKLTHKLTALGQSVESKVEASAPQRLSVSISINRRASFLVSFAAVPIPSPPQEGTSGTTARAPDKGPKGKAPTPPGAGLPPLGKVAIVIDDLGVDLKAAKALLAIPLALTFSVMPQQAHSREISKLAHDRGREVLVHMPMEPHGYPQVNPGPGALLVSMGGDRLRQALQSALASVPYASGVNNHMGSTFTEQAEPMRMVLAELRKRGFYFLDSYTTPESVACGVAEQLQVPCGRRDIFLDHEIHEDFVRSQIQRLIREAKIQGASVAIGHPHAVTLKVLQQESARFAEERVAVVPLREVLRHASPLRRDSRH